MKDFIHSHKFSDLHDNYKIIYTRGTTNNILNAFNFINSFKNKVILITANEDTTIDDNWANMCPSNLHLWFAQNGISDNPKIKIIPEVLITGGGDGQNGPINGLLGLQLLDGILDRNAKKDASNGSASDNKKDEGKK